jgi:hypothetical protein
LKHLRKSNLRAGPSVREFTRRRSNLGAATVRTGNRLLAHPPVLNRCLVARPARDIARDTLRSRPIPHGLSPFSGRPRSAYDVRGRVLDQFWIGSRPPSHAIDRPVSRAEPAGDLSETQAFAPESLDFDWVQRSPWAASAVHRRRQWTPPPARPGLVTKVCPRVCPKVCPSRGDSGGHGVSVSTEK